MYDYDDFTPAERASMIATRPPESLRTRPTPSFVQAHRSYWALATVGGVILGGVATYPFIPPLILGLFAAAGYFTWWRYQGSRERLARRIEKAWARRVRLYVATITEQPEANLVALFDTPATRDHVIHDGSNFTFHGLDHLLEGDRHVWIIVEHDGEVTITSETIPHEPEAKAPVIRLPVIVEAAREAPVRLYQPRNRVASPKDPAPAVA